MAKPSSPAPNEGCKYWAFISYSHRDSRWAGWLHRALEGYRIPRPLSARQGRGGRLARRIFPVFRDREELPGSPELGENITAALKQSRALIVICSPRSAVSRWVNEEIKTFKALGRADRVFCMIVDGEPNASDKPDEGLLECFPLAIRHPVSPGGDILTAARVEPIAADVRPGKDGKNNALLKLIAGLLGVDYDALKQRERQRRRQRLALGAAVSFALVACFAAFWVGLENSKAIEAGVEQGRQEFLAGNSQRALCLLNDAYRRGGNSPALRFLLGQALQGTDEHPIAIGDPGEFVQTLAFDKAGVRFVTADNDQSASVWDSVAGRRFCRLQGNPSRVTAAAFSADGQRVATASGEIVRVWAATEGWMLAELSGHEYGVKTVAFSPDDKLILTASVDNTAKVWDAASGKLLRTLEGHDATVTSASFDAAGSRVFTTSADGTGKIWDAASGKPMVTLDTQGIMLTRGFLSPDGLYAVAFGTDEAARIWETGSGRQVKIVKGVGGIGNSSVAFDLDHGRILATSTIGSNTARVWNLLDGAVVCTFVGHHGPVHWVELSRDGSRAVTASRDNTVKVWDAGSGQALTTFEDIKGFYHTAAHISPGGTRVLTEDEQGHTSLRDATNGRLRFVHPAASAEFAAGGTRLLTENKDGTTIGLWEVATGTELASADLQAEQGRCVAVSAGGDRILVASPSSVEVRSLEKTGTGKTLLKLEGDIQPVNAAAFSPDLERVAVVFGIRDGGKKTLRVWNGRTGSVVWSKTPPNPAHGWTYLRFSPDSRLLWANQNPGTDSWEAATGRPIRSFGGIMASDFHDDRIVAPEDRGTTQRNGVQRWRPLAVVYSVSTGKQLAACEGHSEGILSAVFSPHGDWIATAGGGDLTAKVWNASNGQLLLSLEGHRGPVTGVFFSPDQARVVTTGWDGAARIWDAVNGKLLALIEGHGGVISSAKFSPDGGSLLTFGDDGRARLWSLPMESRSPAEVDALVKVRTPWRLVGGRLIAGAR